MKIYCPPKIESLRNFEEIRMARLQTGGNIGGIQQISCILDTTPEELVEDGCIREQNAVLTPGQCFEVDLRFTNGTDNVINTVAWGEFAGSPGIVVTAPAFDTTNQQGGTGGPFSPGETVGLTDATTDFDLGISGGGSGPFTLTFPFSADGSVGTVQCIFSVGDPDGTVSPGIISS